MFHYLTEMPTLDAEGKAVFGSVRVGTQCLIHAGCVLQGPLRGHIPRALLKWHHKFAQNSDRYPLPEGHAGQILTGQRDCYYDIPREVRTNPQTQRSHTTDSYPNSSPLHKVLFPPWMYGSIRDIRCKVYVSIMNRDTKKITPLSFVIFGLDPLFHKAFIQKVCANLKTILASLTFCDQWSQMLYCLWDNDNHNHQ